MSERAVVVLCLIASWLVLGCSGQLRVRDDDDAAGDDDDAVGDDDDAVGDDDDAVGDDDDAVGDDDDAADDDDDVTDDDDDVTDDDDDDDDSLPAQPGIVFTVPSGDLAGTYEYYENAFCGDYAGELLLFASPNHNYEIGFELLAYQQPQPNDHMTWQFGIYWWDHEDWAWGDGGPHCTFDTGPEAWPHTTGFFECEELYYEPQFGPAFTFQITDGAVRCP